MMNEKIRVSTIARMIDHSILHPTYSDTDLERECKLAKKYKVTTVCVKPCHTKLASVALWTSEVEVCTVVGFPHGSTTIDIKLKEAQEALFLGASEIDMVVNIGKVLQKDWAYVEKEISIVNQVCVSNGAILKVIFETDFLPEDEFKIKLCEICNRVKVAFVKTSTGYGFKKNEAGTYFYDGTTDHDLELMRKYCSPEVQIKAAGGIRTFDDVMRVRKLGVTRVGATATVAILEEAKRSLR